MLSKQNMFGRRDALTGGRDPRTVPYGTPATATPAPTTSSPAAPVAGETAEPGPETKPAVAPAKPNGSRLIVGPDVKLKGAEIHDCDTLVVEGRVEATMDSRVIQIAEKGAFAGKVGIDVAEVHGRFEGELTARSQLVIHATGKVSGKIRYGKILIEEGGEVSGDVRSLSAEDRGPVGAGRPESELRSGIGVVQPGTA